MRSRAVCVVHCASVLCVEVFADYPRDMWRSYRSKSVGSKTYLEALWFRKLLVTTILHSTINP